jgi:hypothetical protein
MSVMKTLEKMMVALALSGSLLTGCSKPSEPDRKIASMEKPVYVEPSDIVVDGSSWKKYELKDYPEYNSLLPIMNEVSKKYDISLEHLAVIALVETKGKGGERYESGFQKKYIDPKFEGKETNDNRRYRDFFASQENVTLEDFKKQLSTSYGPWQVMYASAFDKADFKGSASELADAKTNCEVTAKMWQKAKINNESSLDEVARYHNTGSNKGTPYKGYFERINYYKNLLGLK